MPDLDVSMSWANTLRRIRLGGSTIFVGLLLAACATTPPTPPVELPPVEDEDPDGPGAETPDGAEILDPDPEMPTDEGDVEPQIEPVVPPHMANRDIRRIGVLLPFSHGNRTVRDEAQSLLAAIELALFEQAGDQILILPKDTGGDPERAAEMAGEAILQGAEILVGPLFGSSVQSVSLVARESEVPVLAFSNDRMAAGGGSYLVSLPPEEEIERVVDWASLRGVDRFLMLGPESRYGRRVESALRFEVARRGGQVLAAEFYSPSNDAPVDEAQRLAERIKAELQFDRRRVAVMIPERGIKLRSVAPLLPYYGVDMRQVLLVGTGQWNDPTIWREPTLNGGVFATPSPSDADLFQQSYQAAYKAEPTSLAALGYDAAALAIALLSQENFSLRDIEHPDGFRGANGLYRFRIDGTVDRGLALVEITPDGLELVEPGWSSFDFGGS